LEDNGKANICIGEEAMYDSISIVIPVYNEKENILKTISEIKED
jgi:hypothetical protein